MEIGKSDKTVNINSIVSGSMPRFVLTNVNEILFDGLTRPVKFLQRRNEPYCRLHQTLKRPSSLKNKLDLFLRAGLVFNGLASPV
jgi:hypothetical protein